MTPADSHPRTPRRHGVTAVARLLRPALALGASIAMTFVCACGSKASGVDVCKQIETARCNAAPACGISLTPPYYTSGTAADACIRYYDVACLDGLQVAGPSSAEVTACVDAISTKSPANCAYVTTPADSPACAWLSTSDAGGVDAATSTPGAADASDAAVAAEAGVSATTDAALDAASAGD